MLIKDLNGNRVIQKCLNKLAQRTTTGELTRKYSTSIHANNAPGVQLIYNADAANCVEVGAQRHRCSVH